MIDAERFKLLFGPYGTPRFRYGKAVQYEVRGEVTICGLTDAPIPWPIGKRGRAKSLVVCKGLAQAIRRESNQAVCHWWGLTAQTVSKWRKALGIPSVTPGTHRLFSANYFDGGHNRVMSAKSRERMRDPEVRAKTGAAKRGKPMPAHVAKILRAAHLGAHHGAETRRKMSETHRRRGTRPVGIGPKWLPDEDEMLRTLRPAEAAQRTGRTIDAVYSRRRVLGLPDGRAEGQAHRRKQASDHHNNDPVPKQPQVKK